jgi:hypothetical protein
MFKIPEPTLPSKVKECCEANLDAKRLWILVMKLGTVVKDSKGGGDSISAITC